MKRSIDTYCAIVKARYAGVVERHGPMQSLDCGFGILLEEIAEFFDEVRKKEESRDTNRVADELIDIGVCCVRMMSGRHTPEDFMEFIKASYLESPSSIWPKSLHGTYAMLFICITQSNEAAERGLNTMSGIAGIAACAFCNLVGEEVAA